MWLHLFFSAFEIQLHLAPLGRLWCRVVRHQSLWWKEVPAMSQLSWQHLQSNDFPMKTCDFQDGHGSFCLKKQAKTKRLTPWDGGFDGILRKEDLKVYFGEFCKSFPKCWDTKIPLLFGEQLGFYFKLDSTCKKCHKTRATQKNVQQKHQVMKRNQPRKRPLGSFRPGGFAREDVGCWWTWFFASHGSCKGFTRTMGWTGQNHGLCAQLLCAR